MCPSDSLNKYSGVNYRKAVYPFFNLGAKLRQEFVKSL